MLGKHPNFKLEVAKIGTAVNILNPPAPKVLGRDLPDGTRKRLQVYLGGGHFSAKTLCF